MILGAELVGDEELRVVPVVVILVISFVLSVIVIAVAAIMLILQGVVDFSDLFQAIIALAVPIFDVSLLVVTLVYVVKKELFKFMGLTLNGKFIAAGLLWGLALFTINLVISYSMSQVLGEEFTGRIYEYLISYRLTRYVLIVTAILLAPIAEELYFRGLLYASLKIKIGVLGGAIVSAAIFAAAHGIPAAFIALLAIGATLAYIFEKYKSLVPAIMAHAVNNTLGIAILLILKH